MGITQLRARVEQLTATIQRHHIPDPPSDADKFRLHRRMFRPDWADNPPTQDHAEWWQRYGLVDEAWI